MRELGLAPLAAAHSVAKGGPLDAEELICLRVVAASLEERREDRAAWLRPGSAAARRALLPLRRSAPHGTRPPRPLVARPRDRRGGGEEDATFRALWRAQRLSQTARALRSTSRFLEPPEATSAQPRLRGTESR